MRPAEVEVFLLVVGRGPLGQHARLGEQRRDERGRIDQLDSVVAQHRRDRADQAVGIPPPQLREHRQQRRVRQQPGREDLGVLDLARHHRVRDARLLEQLDAGPELAERDPVDRAPDARRRIVQFGKGLFLGGDNRDVVALSDGRVEHQKGKPAVTGNQAKAHR